MWANFHTHSKYCDGKGELIEYAKAAREFQVTRLGFSSHAPLPFDCSWSMRGDKLQGYFDDVDHVKKTYPDIEIYKSLEIDFIPDVISPYQFKDQLDYTIGSIHFVDQFPDGRRWEIDGPHNLFLEGLETIFKGDFRKAFIRYFELTREMIYASSPTIIGHLDKIKIQNLNGKFFNETDDWYRQEVMKTLKLIEQADIIVEVNTRGLYQKKSDTPYPSPWILEVIKEKNIPITLSSDAHHPSDLVNHFRETAALLLKLGFKNISILNAGNWEQVSL